MVRKDSGELLPLDLSAHDKEERGAKNATKAYMLVRKHISPLYLRERPPEGRFELLELNYILFG